MDGTSASAISRYRFVSRIAVGGMAEIYAADAAGAAGVTRRVAIKRVLPQNARDEVFIKMFVKEARVASTLQHPNIVQTYDVLDVGGSHLIVMELLRGMNLVELRRHLHQLGRSLTAAQSLYIIDRVLSGLHYAHERTALDGAHLQLVHRDVSLHNVFITAEGAVKLLDFGVAKAAELLDNRGTSSGVVKGKVLYMSPEQAQGLEVDRRTDIWAVGVLLHMLLTNRAPFKGKNSYDTMRAIIHDDAPPPSSLVPTLTPGLDALVARALSKDRDERFQTSREMQRAINELLRQEGGVLTDLEFTGFVEEILGSWEGPEPDISNLPGDLVISEGGTEQVERFGGSASASVSPSGSGPMAETEHAVVSRVRGQTVLHLRGVLDERFDPDAFVYQLDGTVIIDAEAVERITSYGIRGLIRFAEVSHGHIKPYYVNCSVAFVQQLGMIRKVIGSGKVLSFHLPYVDPENGHAFTVLLRGESAYRALTSQEAPVVACPGFEQRNAEFDEDPHGYLCFVDDFQVEPPAAVAAALDDLALEESRREVEMSVTGEGTDLYIRRPIDEGYRWRKVIAGLEGAVSIDMAATPAWSDAGLERLVQALDKETPPITGLTLLHAPAPLMRRALQLRGLSRAVLDRSTVRVHARCAECKTARRIAVPLQGSTEIGTGTLLTEACPSCGGHLLSSDDLTHLTPRHVAPTPILQSRVEAPVVAPQPSTDLSRYLLWGSVALAWTLLLLIIAIIFLLFLLMR